MRDMWLLEVLADIETYAIQNDLDWLVPMINKVNLAARREIGGNAGLAVNLERTGNNVKVIDGESRVELKLGGKSP